MPNGITSDLGLIFQTAFGTPGNVNSIHFIPFMSEGVGLNIPPIISENMRGVFDEGDSYAGARTADGDIECEAQPISLGAILKSVMNLTGSVQSGGIYTHTFKPHVTDVSTVSAGNPVTLYKYLDTGSAMLFSDLNGTALELGIANGELLKAKASYVGGNFTQNANVSASYPIGKRWTWDTTSVSLGGAGIADVVNMTVALDESLEAQHTLNGSPYCSSIKHTGARTVTIDGTLKFNTQAEYQQFLSQSEREMVIHFEGTTEVQSGYYEALTMTLPAMRYEEMKPSASGPGHIEVSVTAKGKYHVGSATALEITLVNTQATY